MITKKDLENYRYDMEYIKKSKYHIIDILDQTNKITSSLSHTHITSAVPDKMGENVAKILDMQNELLNKIKETEEKLNKIREVIDLMPQPYKNAIYFRYIVGEKIPQLAGELGYEYRYTKKVLKKALYIFIEVQKKTRA